MDNLPVVSSDNPEVIVTEIVGLGPATIHKCMVCIILFVCRLSAAQENVSINENQLWGTGMQAPKEMTAASTTQVDLGKAGIEWVTIPGGSFIMGTDELFWYTQPRHKVTVKTFQMAKTLVTNKQYRACVKDGACTQAMDFGSDFNSDDQPVVGVDWYQAKSFCKWVGGRLPSEAEWEYAARSGGKEQKYPWGNEEATCVRAVIFSSAGVYGYGNGCGRLATWSVGSKPAGNTMQGLSDMAGNVYEWVQDTWHDSYEGAPTNGSAWESPVGPFRVFRGGSWANDAKGARSANRIDVEPSHRDNGLGFRPVRSR